MKKPRVRRHEATRSEVERLKFGIEVDVEPFATSGLRLSRCEANDASTDLFVLNGAAGLGVDQEGVIAAVACDVDEPDEGVVFGSGSHPTEAVRAYLVPPSGCGHPAMRLDEIHHLFVVKRPTPPQHDPVRERFRRFGNHAPTR